MKKCFTIPLLALLLCATRSLNAEKPDLVSPADDFPSAVGVFGSTYNGGGLSYQRWNGQAGWQVTAGGKALPANYYSYWNYALSGDKATTDAFNWGYNVQVDFLYKLYASNFWEWLSGDLFAFASVSHRGASAAVWVDDSGDSGDTDYSGHYEDGEYIPTFSAALGIGYEITLFRHFSFPIMFGYMGEWPLSVDFCVSGGMRYRY